ncbi:hypothetical protein ACFQ0M_37130 [Kitasatospora aburaviensis]
MADSRWVAALAEAFRSDDRIGCVTGLVLPAELDTEAQFVVEEYCGPGRGFAARSWSLREPLADPLVQFSTGRFGMGANMAFRTDVIRSLGGFDPATGTGTLARRGGPALLPAGADRRAHRRLPARRDHLAPAPADHGGARHPDQRLRGRVRRLPGGGDRAPAEPARRAGPPAALRGVALARQPPGDPARRAGRHRHPAQPPQAGAPGLLYGPFCYLFTVWQQRRPGAAGRAGGQSS